MAIDYGSKAIGLAISDELQMTVRPLTTIRRGKLKQDQFIENICQLIAEYEAGLIVVGLPLNMDGTRGEAVLKVENFISKLRLRLSIPIATIDERLTSFEADRILREMGVSPKERKTKSDEYAAVLILQDYLDEQARQINNSNSSFQ